MTFGADMTDPDNPAADDGPLDRSPSFEQLRADALDLQAGLADLATLVTSSLALEELLGRVAVAAARAVPGADGAGVTLLRVDRRQAHGRGAGRERPVRPRNR